MSFYEDIFIINSLSIVWLLNLPLDLYDNHYHGMATKG